MAALLSFKTAKKFGLDKHKYTSAEKGMCYLLSAATVLSTIALLSIMRVSTLIHHMTGAMYEKPFNWVVLNVPAILTFIMFLIMVAAYYLHGRIRYRNLCTILFFLSVLVGLFCATLLSFGSVAITGVMYIQLPDGTTGGIDAMLAYLSMYWGAAKLHYGIMAVMAIISALFLLLIKILGGAEEEETSGNFGTAKMADSKYLKSENVVLGRSPTQRKRTIDPINCQIAYGKFQGKYIGSDDIEPQLVIAPQREGKTATICIPFLLDCPFNVFALDQKGELFLTTYKQREALGKKPMVLDPFNILDQFGDFEKYKIKGFNPLDVKLDSDIDRERYVLALCDALIMFEAANASDNHFTDAAYGIMRGLLDGFLNQGYSMKHVYDRIVLQPGKEFVGILKDINNDLKSRFLLTGIAYLEKAGDKERGSMETTILRCFDWLAGGTMANFFDQGRFPVEQFVEGNSDIFLVLPPDMIKRYSRVVRLVISTAGSKIIRTPVSKLHKRYPFLIDEIAQLKYFPYIEEMIEVGGGYGIRVIAIFQTLSQVREYKKADLFENMQVKHFFATTDMKTMDWIKRLGGTKTIKNISSSESSNQKRKFLSSPENLGTSTSEQEVGTTLIHDDQITTMPVDEKWLFISKKRPIKCKKIYYFEDPRYAGKYQDNPIETR